MKCSLIDSLVLWIWICDSYSESYFIHCSSNNSLLHSISFLCGVVDDVHSSEWTFSATWVFVGDIFQLIKNIFCWHQLLPLAEEVKNRKKSIVWLSGKEGSLIGLARIQTTQDAQHGMGRGSNGGQKEKEKERVRKEGCGKRRCGTQGQDKLFLQPHN